MTLSPATICENGSHVYVCTLTQNQCIWCGHIQGAVVNEANKNLGLTFLSTVGGTCSIDGDC